jgi:hypothetical protein
MNRVEELPDGDHILQSLARCATTGSTSRAAPGHAELRSFQVVFEGLRKTPDMLRLLLQREFQFDGVVNACIPAAVRGDALLAQVWYARSFVVPNYSQIRLWVTKCVAEARLGKTIVALLPSRTNTKWFNELVLCAASEVRFIEGRITMPGFTTQTPFPDCIAIYRGPSAGAPERAPQRAVGAVGILSLSTAITGDSSQFSVVVPPGEEEEEEG